jgi:hypothetical protein
MTLEDIVDAGGLEVHHHRRHAGRRREMRPEAGVEDVGRLDAVAGEAEIDAELARHVRQVVAGTDIGEQADPRLRHRQQRLFRHHAIAPRRRYADAAAHGDAVHEGDAGLGVGIFEMVEAIFVEEEGSSGRVGALDVEADVNHITAGTESPALGMIDQDDAHVGVVAPFDQRGCHVANHLAIEAVQRLGPVEAEAAGQPFLGGEDVGVQIGHQIHFIIT